MGASIEKIQPPSFYSIFGALTQIECDIIYFFWYNLSSFRYNLARLHPRCSKIEHGPIDESGPNRNIDKSPRI